MSRAVGVWAVLVLVLAALSTREGVASPALAVALAGIVGFAVAVGARTSVVLAGLRRQRIVVDTGNHGAVHRSVPAGVVGLVVGVASAGAAAALSGVIPLPSFAVVAAVGTVAIVAAVAWPLPVALASRDRQAWAWLLTGALQAAVVAACLGGVVALARFHGLDVVKPGELSRTMAGTLLCDGLLGIGGFARAAVERSRGLVRLGDVALPAAPGPVGVALVLAAATILVGPMVLPVFSGTGAVVMKVVVGAVVGGVLHLCGGLRGARAGTAAGVSSSS